MRKYSAKLIRLHRNAKRKCNHYHWKKYRNCNRSYHEQLDKAEASDNKKLCDSLADSQHIKIWWKTVNTGLGKGNNLSYPPMYNDDNNTYVYDSKDKAELFNEFSLSHGNIGDSANVPDDESNLKINT